ncbi:MAG: hypothetical protein P8125_14070, partial [Gemmatimonadota bacterium]
MLVSLALPLPALLPPIQARALAQEAPEFPASGTHDGLPARDTLFLIGDARIDPGLAARGRSEPDLVTAAWRRALGFVEWTDGAVLVADGASNYVELARKDPRLADSVRTAVRAGAWSPVGGWWTRGDPGSLSGESLIRQGLYGQRAFERVLGRRPTVAWLDAGSRLPSTLPQILGGSGLTSLIRVGSEAERGESIPGTQATPSALYWEGNDGTRIQVYRPYDYGDFADFEFEFPGPRAVGEGGRGHRLAIYGVRDPEWESAATGSIAAPAGESFEPVERDRRPTGAQSAVPVVRFASPERALAAIREAGGGEPPTASGEIVPPGAFSMPSEAGSATTHADGETAARIRTESVLQTAEAVSAVAAGLPGAVAYPGSTLEWIWRELLEAAALSRDPSGRGATDMARHEVLASASNTADSLITEMFNVIRAEMETDAEPIGAYVLFNPLAHVRRGVAFVEIGRGGREEGARSEARDLLLVNVPEIPALGAIALPIGADGLPGVLPADIQPPAAGDLWLENAFL